MNELFFIVVTLLSPYRGDDVVYLGPFLTYEVCEDARIESRDKILEYADAAGLEVDELLECKSSNDVK